MIDEIKRYVSFLKTGNKLSPGVVSKFEEFRLWALEQVNAETAWKPSKEFRMRENTDGELVSTGESLPPTLIRTERYMAFERLLVLLATIPRLPPPERRSRADEIMEACEFLDTVTPKNSSRRGRLKKAESKIKKSQLLALLADHPSLVKDPERAAIQVGVSSSQVRRWVQEFRKSNVDRKDQDDDE